MNINQKNTCSNYSNNCLSPWLEDFQGQPIEIDYPFKAQVFAENQSQTTEEINQIQNENENQSNENETKTKKGEGLTTKQKKLIFELYVKNGMEQSKVIKKLNDDEKQRTAYRFIKELKSLKNECEETYNQLSFDDAIQQIQQNKKEQKTDKFLTPEQRILVKNFLEGQEFKKLKPMMESLSEKFSFIKEKDQNKISKYFQRNYKKYYQKQDRKVETKQNNKQTKKNEKNQQQILKPQQNFQIFSQQKQEPFDFDNQELNNNFYNQQQENYNYNQQQENYSQLLQQNQNVNFDSNLFQEQQIQIQNQNFSFDSNFAYQNSSSMNINFSNEEQNSFDYFSQ
ncbi:hypothetical protein PPERSA_06585 [Pseudocohnilembus persalinus]|uniref:Uncharacterized protein n=1 Tax=Pseudocohnilembus persalinus TaxID=266149 RepID=A0A0V0QS52_PSEPJ|nr:hypothetical protein PPERSA_06585 [Pseudocohnilembus persalinus]|eukprot:KRX04951.1 hypothetical protein PPERSA_06585 [Pseudocohnilembus persalinus]